MKRFALMCFRSIMIGLVVLCGFSTSVEAKVVGSDDSDSVIISGGGGIFYPFQGRSGFNALVQVMGIVSPQERFGVELEFRKYETEFFNAKNIDTKSYIVRGIGQYFFRSHGISPYVGLGLNLAVNDFDGNEVERKEPSVDVKTGWGIGYGVTGLVGIEVPVGDIAFFGEGRVSGDFQVTIYEKRSGKNKVNFESLSGFTGMGGIRMRF